jgi:opacity protein-like surface antigen
MTRNLIAALALTVSATVPASAADPLSSLRFLVGAWNCTYLAGKVHMNYKAMFAYDLGGNWMRESDNWTGGGGDLGMFTYEAKHHAWTAVIMENERTTTLFRASGSNPNHIVYRSVYPTAGMTDVFERTSPTRYTIRFTQSGGGKTLKSTDTCIKA